MSRARDTADQINRVNSSAADATAITVDSSENVMIGGHTSTHSPVENGGSGVSLLSNGQILAGGEYPSYFNRENSDGDIIVLRKDGSAVGSIGVNSGDQVYFAASDGMGIKVDTDNTSVEASNASGADNDNAVNLGSSGTRWKDLYLSGGIYLGGTGSANKLDSYEEGTWTPAPSVGTASSASGTYTKIGRMVVVTGFVSGMNTVNNETMNIGGLPFTGGNIVQCVGQAMWSNVDKDFGYEQVFYTGGSKLQFYHTTNANFDPIRHIDLDGSNSACYFSATYFV
jgi:hypothetical protein